RIENDQAQRPRGVVVAQTPRLRLHDRTFKVAVDVKRGPDDTVLRIPLDGLVREHRQGPESAAGVKVARSNPILRLLDADPERGKVVADPRRHGGDEGGLGRATPPEEPGYALHRQEGV